MTAISRPDPVSGAAWNFRDGQLEVYPQVAGDESAIIMTAPTTAADSAMVVSSTGFRAVTMAPGINFADGSDLIAVVLSTIVEDYTVVKGVLDAIDTDQGTPTLIARPNTILLRTLADIATIVAPDNGRIKTIGAKTIVGTARQVYLQVTA